MNDKERQQFNGTLITKEQALFDYCYRERHSEGLKAVNDMYNELKEIMEMKK